MSGCLFEHHFRLHQFPFFCVLAVFLQLRVELPVVPTHFGRTNKSSLLHKLAWSIDFGGYYENNSRHSRRGVGCWNNTEEIDWTIEFQRNETFLSIAPVRVNSFVNTQTEGLTAPMYSLYEIYTDQFLLKLYGPQNCLYSFDFTVAIFFSFTQTYRVRVNLRFKMHLLVTQIVRNLISVFNVTFSRIKKILFSQELL